MIGEVILAIITVIAVAGIIWRDERAKAKEKIYQDVIDELKIKLETTREDTINQSRSTIRGQVSEQIIPIFPDFPYNLGDCYFSGKPLDFTVFENLTSLRDGNKDAKVNIILADVKYNRAKRSPYQNAIKEAIEQGRVRFETWRILPDNSIKIEVKNSKVNM